MTKKAIFSIALAAACATNAMASEAEMTTEWRVLGPAFSKHFSKDGAAVTKPATETQECRDWANQQPAQSVVSPTPLSPRPGLTFVGQDANGNYVYRSTPVPTLPRECTTTVNPAERGWHGNNPAAGIEYTRRFRDHSDKLYGQLVRDSYGKPGLMLGAARQWPLFTAQRLTVDAGLSAGIWSRTDLDQRRRVVPFIFPALSLSEERTGLGLNAAIVPKLSINGRVYVSTPTLMLQITYRLR